jgi:hypothetical protein
MAATMQVELNADEIRELASILQKTPEETAENVVANGMHMLRRYAFYIKNPGQVTPEEGIAILKMAGRGNSPDSGDELPEGF